MNGLKPTGDVGVGFTPLLVQYILETAGKYVCAEDIGKSDAFADKVGVDKQMVLHDLERCVGVLLCFFYILLVKWIAAYEGPEPCTDGPEHVRIAKGHPSQDGRVVLFGFAKKLCLFVLRGDYSAILALAA